MENHRVTYSVDEVAEILGVGRNTAYEAVASGQLPHIRIGSKRIVIPKAALSKFLEACGQPAAQ